MEQNPSDNKKKLIITIVLGIALVIGLCVLSSRFSWFGTQQNPNDNIEKLMLETTSDTTTVTRLNKVEGDTVDYDDEPIVTTPETTTVTITETAPVSTTAETTKAVTTTTKKAETTKKPVTTTAETTVTETTTAITTTAKPEPLWTEKEVTASDMYIVLDCNAREQAVQGAQVVGTYTSGDKVTVVAKTNTDYSKISDGSFIHNDFLSENKPVETTVTTTAETEKEPTVQSSKPSSDSSSFVNRVFELVNEERVAYGLSPYTFDSTLCAGAQIRSGEIISVFSHLRPDGSRAYTALDLDGNGDGSTESEVGRVFSSVGENIAAGQTSPEEVVQKWMNSEGHRANILSSRFTHVGVGYTKTNSNYEFYWTLMFGAYK